MNLEMFVGLGIRFDFCYGSMMPEIPHVEDVFYVMGLSEEPRYYGDLRAVNHATYVVNVALVVAAIGHEVLGGMERYYDEEVARRIIARAIIELCPEEAKCLFKKAYVEARRVLGHEVPPEGSPSRVVVTACSCMRCRDRAREYAAEGANG